MDRVPPCRVKHVFNNGTVTIRQLSWMKFATSEINTFLAHCVMSRQLRGTVLLVKRTQTLVIFCRRGQRLEILIWQNDADTDLRRSRKVLFCCEWKGTWFVIWPVKLAHHYHMRQHLQCDERLCRIENGPKSLFTSSNTQSSKPPKTWFQIFSISRFIRAVDRCDWQWPFNTSSSLSSYFIFWLNTDWWAELCIAFVQLRSLQTGTTGQKGKMSSLK